MPWKPIPGYEDRYEASAEGKIRNRRTGRLLKPHLTHDGYPRLTLYGQDAKCLYTVHVLVAATFLGPRPEGYQIDHKDGNKLNAAVTNLEYVTSAENNKRATKNGLKARGSRQWYSKLTEDQVRMILKRYAAGDSWYLMSKELGVTPQTVWLIVKRKNWAWVQV